MRHSNKRKKHHRTTRLRQFLTQENSEAIPQEYIQRDRSDRRICFYIWEPSTRGLNGPYYSYDEAQQMAANKVKGYYEIKQISTSNLNEASRRMRGKELHDEHTTFEDTLKRMKHKL